MPAPGSATSGSPLPRAERPIHILLTHLHLDHIQGLMFFAPCFRPESEIVIWGPASPEASLRDRIARYISAPLAPVEVRELPSLVSFREADAVEWEIGPARIRAQAVNHRGPTLGYRIEDGPTTLCYIPDHEPGLGQPLAECEDEWISGFDLARGADLLVHDCQYTDEEYREHLGLGPLPGVRRARLRAAGRPCSDCSCSTTTRCTPTTSWTACGRRSPSAGRGSVAARKRSRSPPSATSSR